MPLRIFKCDECGHRMRAWSSTCGACTTPKRAVQGPLAVAALALAGAAAMLAVAVGTVALVAG